MAEYRRDEGTPWPEEGEPPEAPDPSPPHWEPILRVVLMFGLAVVALAATSGGHFPVPAAAQPVLVLDLLYDESRQPVVTVEGWHLGRKFGPRLDTAAGEWALELRLRDGSRRRYGLRDPRREERLDATGEPAGTRLLRVVRWSQALPLFDEAGPLPVREVVLFDDSGRALTSFQVTPRDLAAVMGVRR